MALLVLFAGCATNSGSRADASVSAKKASIRFVSVKATRTAKGLKIDCPRLPGFSDRKMEMFRMLMPVYVGAIRNLKLGESTEVQVDLKEMAEDLKGALSDMGLTPPAK